MRLNRFYTERTNVRVGSSVKLPESDNNHIKKVLRLSKGDKVIIFNGEKEFEAELKIVSKDVVMVELTKLLREEDFSGENKVELALIQGLLRAGKIDMILEKVTELGIDYIIGLECEYSQTKVEKVQDKLDRWKRIVLSASKQAELVKIPEILQPIKFADLKDLIPQFDRTFILTIPRDNTGFEIKNLKDVEKGKEKKVGFLIGPEGGFSPKEHKLAKELGIEFVTFSKTILRSETAAIAGATLMNYIYNN